MATPKPNGARDGFLPIRTNLFDRFFISVVLFIALHLMWMRLLEAHVSLTVCTIVSIVLGVLIVRRG